MKKVSRDIKEKEPCKSNPTKSHAFQWVKKDEQGKVWQHCTGCDRKLFVR